MKKYFITAIIGLFAGMGLAQDQPIYFSKHHDLTISDNDAGIRVINIPGGYAFISWGYPYGSAFAVADLNGELIHKKQYFPESNRIEGLYYNEIDSTFLLWGDYYLGNNDLMMYLLKTNFQGDTIWVKEYNPSGCDRPRNMLVLPDRSMMLVCRGLNIDLVNVIKTDPDGNFLWHKAFDFGFLGFHDAWGIILANDSTVTVSYEGGSIYLPDPDTTRLYWNGMGLIDMDFEGNIRRDSVYLFDYGGSDLSGPCLVKSNETGIMYVSAAKEDEVASTGGADMIHAFDEKTWELLWSFRFDEIGFGPFDKAWDPYLADFTVNHKGNVVVCGKQWNLQYAAASDGNGFLPWFAEVSKDGELLWQRWVGWPTICDSIVCDILSSFEQIQATDDGGYILTGQYGLENATVEAWLLKVDSMGCLEPGCTDRDVVVPVREPPITPKTLYHISPNPADATVLVTPQGSAPTGAVLTLYNVHGQLIRQAQLPENDAAFSLPVADLSNGLYMYLIRSGQGEQQSGKVIVAH